MRNPDSHVGRVTLSLAGNPLPYRHRSAATGHRYLPKRQRDQLACLKLAATEAMNGRDPFDAPVQLELQVYLPIPKAWSKRKRYEALLGNVLPTVRPDLTNILKLSEDACTGIVFRDDSLICKHLTRKQYSAQPKITITVSLIECSQQRN